MLNIEELILKAIAEGKFDDLPGKGKPLNLPENPHEDEEWRLAYHILRDSGFSLPWIETIREIEAEVEQARHALRLAYEWHTQALSQNQPTLPIQAEWKRAVNTFSEQLASLNRRIRDNNLQAPIVRFQRPLLSLEREIKDLNTGLPELE